MKWQSQVSRFAQQFSVQLAFTLVVGLAPLEVQAEDASPSEAAPVIEQKTKLLGHDLSVKQSGTAVPSNLGVRASTSYQFVGANKSLAEASVEAIPVESTSVTTASTSSETPNGGVIARTDWYISGTRVWNGSLQWENGSLSYSGGVSPTQIPIPLVVYPVGPLILEVDAGVEFEGDLKASLTPGLSYPLPDSDLTAKLETKLVASGYLEGYAKILFVRGGVGGRLDLINGSAGVGATLHLNHLKPTIGNLGKVVLLSGKVYGFVDAKILFGKWNRVLNKNFYSWQGKCFAFGGSACPSTALAN